MAEQAAKNSEWIALVANGIVFMYLILLIVEKIELVDNFGFFGGKLYVFQ
jgi:hypothetical protein